jgi:hypothetical protein
MPHTYRVYSFSYNNPERKKAMDERFAKTGLVVNWVEPVLSTDARIQQAQLLETSSPINPRNHSIMLNHLDMVEEFLKSDVDFGIFCEDDVYIRKGFNKDIYVAIDGYKRLGLEVLLLGYLTNYKAAETHMSGPHYPLEIPFTFLSVPDDLWGSQMYLLDKNGARRVLEEFGDFSKVKTYYNPDWTITKMPKRACIYPMLAVETGSVATDHWGQIAFHKACFETNFKDGEFF